MRSKPCLYITGSDLAHIIPSHKHTDSVYPTVLWVYVHKTWLTQNPIKSATAMLSAPPDEASAKI